MMVCGVSVLKKVELVVTRKPRCLASLIASTASSNTPSLATDSSCRSRSPSMCTANAKYGDGVNFSIFLRSSMALVQRKTYFFFATNCRTISSICGCISGSPPAMETIGAPGLQHRPDRLGDRHALLEHPGRVLDLPAALALEVAGEERLQLDDQRELLALAELLFEEIASRP